MVNRMTQVCINKVCSITRHAAQIGVTFGSAAVVDVTGVEQTIFESEKTCLVLKREKRQIVDVPSHNTSLLFILSSFSLFVQTPFHHVPGRRDAFARCDKETKYGSWSGLSLGPQGDQVILSLSREW